VVITDLLVNPAKRFPDRMCSVEGERGLTFRETNVRASLLAHALVKRGLRPDDRVALLAMNEVEFTEVQIACMRAKLILVPINFRLAIPEMQYAVRDSEPTLLIHGPGFAEHASQLGIADVWHLGPEGFGNPYEELLATGSVPDVVEPLDPDQANSIIYTSGTTGRPKGAVMTNLSIWARVASFHAETQPRESGVFLQCLPMFHMASHLSYSFMVMGNTNVMLREFSPQAVLAHIERYGATDVLMVPTMINMVAQHPTSRDADLSTLKRVLYGASSIAPDVLRHAMDVLGCRFFQFFGMTETSGSTILRESDHDPVLHPEWLASAGSDAVGYDTRIVDDQDCEVPAGVVGEIVTRGAALMKEYWRNPQATAEAMRNGWMHTGDMGYRSSEGFVYITDRKKDMIISGGENVYPREVEDVIYGYPGVFEAAVIGVPDERWGERVHAVVVAKPDEGVSVDELLAYLRTQLASYKVPKSAEVVAELPKNATGKILKTVLREPYWRGVERQVN
jgi:acyl-CoA synthetase (AMP-forming)/AMP-acid ligase II